MKQWLIAAVLATAAAVWHFASREMSAAGGVRPSLPDVGLPPMEQLDLAVLEAHPRGPRSKHCDGSRHPRCDFRRGVAVCERFVVDDFAAPDEVALLRELASALMDKAGRSGEGGVTLVDAAHGVVTYGRQFANLFKLLSSSSSGGSGGSGTAALRTVITERHLATYSRVVERIRQLLLRRFFVPLDSAEANWETSAATVPLALAKPAFISRITNASAAIPNDEYWHVHVDTDQYGVFDITTLLYLSDWTEGEAAAAAESGAEKMGDLEFSGGTFDFVDSEKDEGVKQVLAMPPAQGRLLVFTSGSEHPHRVSRVTGGTRWAMTTAFACGASQSGRDSSSSAASQLSQLRKALGMSGSA